MSQVLDLDNMKHQADLDAFEKREDYIETTASDLARVWLAEYHETEFIEDLGWDKPDVEFLQAESGKSLLTLLDEASDTHVRNNPFPEEH